MSRFFGWELPGIWAAISFALVMLAAGFCLGWWRRRAAQERSAGPRDRLATMARSSVDFGAALHGGAGSLSGSLSSPWEVAPRSLDQALVVNQRLREMIHRADFQLQAQAIELAAQAAFARTDALTNLCNRRAFDDELHRRHAEWQRHETPFSLVMLDIDYFKQLNDQFGHQAGDQKLADVAAAIQEMVRDMDVVARYGGEEFAAILPVTQLAAATFVANRMREAVQNQITRYADLELTVTASAGVTQVCENDTAACLLRRADEALYFGKAAGRNRVCVHDGNLIYELEQALLNLADESDSREAAAARGATSFHAAGGMAELSARTSAEGLAALL